MGSYEKPERFIGDLIMDVMDRIINKKELKRQILRRDRSHIVLSFQDDQDLDQKNAEKLGKYRKEMIEIIGYLVDPDENGYEVQNLSEAFALADKYFKMVPEGTIQEEDEEIILVDEKGQWWMPLDLADDEE